MRLPALDHEPIDLSRTAWGRGEAVSTVHQLKCLFETNTNLYSTIANECHVYSIIIKS